MERFTGLIGLTIVLAVALALSKNRRAIRWRTVGWAFALQMAFGLVVLYWERGKQALESFSNGVSGAIAFADQGAGFLFGWLAGPMDALGEKTGMPFRGFIFAFKVLPIVIFICAFFSILYHFGVIQVIVRGMAWGMQKTMKVSGAEALCVAANVFIGQTEAPVLIAPYIAAMTTSELLTMMTGGMAHVSGAVMLAYVTMGAPLKYLITASVMAAPGTFLISKILWPETETPTTMGTVKMQVEKTSANFIDAAASGASQGMMLVLNISAMLIAFVALIAMLNGTCAQLSIMKRGNGVRARIGASPGNTFTHCYSKLNPRMLPNHEYPIPQREPLLRIVRNRRIHRSMSKPQRLPTPQSRQPSYGCRSAYSEDQELKH